jgi:hypothetical protein
MTEAKKAKTVMNLQGLDKVLKNEITSYLQPGDKQVPQHLRGKTPWFPWEYGDIRLQKYYTTIHTRGYVADSVKPSEIERSITRAYDYERIYKWGNHQHNQTPNAYPKWTPGQFAARGQTERVKQFNVMMARDKKLYDWIWDDKGKDITEIPVMRGDPNYQFDSHEDARW